MKLDQQRSLDAFVRSDAYDATAVAPGQVLYQRDADQLDRRVDVLSAAKGASSTDVGIEKILRNLETDFYGQTSLRGGSEEVLSKTKTPMRVPEVQISPKAIRTFMPEEQKSVTAPPSPAVVEKVLVKDSSWPKQQADYLRGAKLS